MKGRRCDAVQCRVERSVSMCGAYPKNVDRHTLSHFHERRMCDLDVLRSLVEIVHGEERSAVTERLEPHSIGVPKMLQECHKSVRKELQGCYSMALLCAELCSVMYCATLPVVSSPCHSRSRQQTEQLN
jgi:hypothetical protein